MEFCYRIYGEEVIDAEFRLTISTSVACKNRNTTEHRLGNHVGFCLGPQGWNKQDPARCINVVDMIGRSEQTDVGDLRQQVLVALSCAPSGHRSKLGIWHGPCERSEDRNSLVRTWINNCDEPAIKTAKVWEWSRPIRAYRQLDRVEISPTPKIFSKILTYDDDSRHSVQQAGSNSAVNRRVRSEWQCERGACQVYSSRRALF